MICSTCGIEYISYDSDAGTFREIFCSEECEAIMNNRIDEWIEEDSSYDTLHSIPII